MAYIVNYVYNRRIHIIQQKNRHQSPRKRKEIGKIGLAPLAAAPLLLKTKKAKAEETVIEKEELPWQLKKQKYDNQVLLTGGIIVVGFAALIIGYGLLMKRKKIKPTPLIEETTDEKRFEMMRDMRSLETMFFDVTAPQENNSSEKELCRRRIVNILTKKLSDIPYDDYQGVMTIVSKHVSIGELMEILLTKKVTYLIEPEDKIQIMELLDKYLTKDDREEIIKLIRQHNNASTTDHRLH